MITNIDLLGGRVFLKKNPFGINIFKLNIYVRPVIVLNLEKYQFCFQWLGILRVSSIHISLHEPNKRDALKLGKAGKRFVCILKD